MQVQATAKFTRMSPKKIRPLAIVLRQMPTVEALSRLKYHKSKSAMLLAKVVNSAVHNAKNNYNLKEDNLRIEHLTVDEGPTSKRYWFRSRGSSDRLLKRTSHLKVILGEIKPTIIKKPVAKPNISKPILEGQTMTTINEVITGGGPSRPMADTGKKPRVKRGLGRIFTPRTTNK